VPRFGHPATSKIKRDAREDWEMKRADCGGPRCRNADHDKQDGYVEHQKSQVTDMVTDLKSWNQQRIIKSNGLKNGGAEAHNTGRGIRICSAEPEIG